MTEQTEQAETKVALNPSPDRAAENVRDMFRDAIKARGLTHQEVADALGVDRVTVTKQLGQVILNVHQMVALANVVGHPLTITLGPDGVFRLEGPDDETVSLLLGSIEGLWATLDSGEAGFPPVVSLVKTVEGRPQDASTRRYRREDDDAPPTVATDAVIAGALFDFVGWLTTRPGRVPPMGAEYDAAPASELLREWASERDLSLDDADVEGWAD